MTNKYIAIKVKGINHWFWFNTDKVIRENDYFIGNEGWGESGAFTSIKVKETEIDGEITTSTLQYR